MSSSTPSHIHITPRSPEFNFEGLDHTWLDDQYKRHFLYALSIFIPLSERCVSDILRKQIIHIGDKKLKQDIQGFIKQEARHGRLHLEINRMLKQHFKGIGLLETVQTKFIDIARKIFGKKFELAMPVAFEHFTAAISKEILINRSEWLKNNNELTRFVYWHCLEELEHQSVCLDAFDEQYKNRHPITLSLISIWMPISFFTITFTYYILLFQKGHFWNPLNIAKASWFLVKHSKLFFRGGLKYRHKKLNWKDSDQALYKICLEEFQTTDPDKVI